MTHHHAPALHRQGAALHHARASFYDGSRPADGSRGSRFGRYVALPGRHLGERVRVYLPDGGSEVLPVRDVCGTPGRVDMPRGLFVRLMGRKAARRGLVDVRWRFVGGKAKRRRRRG